MGNSANSTQEISALFEKRLALSVKEVALAIGRTPKAVYHMVDRGQIPVKQVTPHGRLEFIPKEIDKWLQKKKRKPRNV